MITTNIDIANRLSFYDTPYLVSCMVANALLGIRYNGRQCYLIFQDVLQTLM